MEAGASFLMEHSSYTSSSHAEQNEAVGRRVNPNNLSRSECKILIGEISRRSEENGKDILTEMWERYNRRVILSYRSSDGVSIPTQRGAFSSPTDFLCVPANRAGMQRPTVEVRFENIKVTARVLVGQQGRSTVLNYYGNCIAVSPEAPVSVQAISAMLLLQATSRE